MIALLWAAMLPTASAAVEVCVDFDADFSGSENGAGDYWTSDANRPLQGVEITLSNTVVDESKFAAASGSSAGCASFDVPLGFYWASITSRARVTNGNNTVLVLNAQSTSNSDYPVGSGSPFEHMLGKVYSTGPGGWNTSYDFVTPATSWSRILGVFAYALQRRAAGVSNTTFRAWTNFNSSHPSVCIDSSCFRASSQAVFSESTRRFVLVHELGHAIGSARNTWKKTRSSYEANPGNCPGASTTTTNGHSMDQKEYQSAAANEGFAHYYAAVTFNNSGHQDCTFAYYKNSDYDLDGVIDPQQLNCELGPALTPSGTGPAGDWMGATCSTPYGNRGSEYDWLRFFWDLDTDPATASTIHTTQIGHIWDHANPYSWRRKD